MCGMVAIHSAERAYDQKHDGLAAHTHGRIERAATNQLDVVTDLAVDKGSVGLCDDQFFDAHFEDDVAIFIEVA